jgi:hypothetical protein
MTSVTQIQAAIVCGNNLKVGINDEQFRSYPT